VPTENVKFSHDGFFIFIILTIYPKAAHPHAAFFISRSYMTQIALMPNKIKHGDTHEISLVEMYVDHNLLKKQVADQDKKLDEILIISRDNQAKLKDIDNLKRTFKASWKFILIIVFLAFMCGLAVDNATVVKQIYSYFTFAH
jgi:hypothetical protein